VQILFSDIPSLPQDILIHIFSFLEISSLVSSAQVSRYFLLYISTLQSLLHLLFFFLLLICFVSSVCSSWNQATHENSLWQSQFDLHFNHKVLIRMQSDIDWREAFKKAYIAANSSEALRSGRGYCSYCDSIVWHENLRCLNKQCRLKSGNKPLDLITTHQVVNYLLGIESSDDESESDDEAFPGRLWKLSYVPDYL
jgi:hypothetical protein